MLAALTHAQWKSLDDIAMISVVGFFVSLAVYRFWVWVIVGWVVADLRRKKVLPPLGWEQARRVTNPGDEVAV
jgi:hypothetical protein